MRGADKSNEFADLLTAQQSSLFAYIYALVHNLRDTEDTYQEMALTLWQKFGDYTAGTNFAAWAQATARFKVLDFLRDKRRSRVYFDDTLLAERNGSLLVAGTHGRVYFDDTLLAELAETAATLETTTHAGTADAYHRALLDCMSRLNAIDQQLVALSYSGTCTLKEVAEQEGRSLQSVCNSLKRIRSTLLDCIEQALNEDHH